MTKLWPSLFATENLLRIIANYSDTFASWSDTTTVAEIGSPRRIGARGIELY